MNQIGNLEVFGLLENPGNFPWTGHFQPQTPWGFFDTEKTSEQDIQDTQIIPANPFTVTAIIRCHCRHHKWPGSQGYPRAGQAAEDVTRAVPP